jgi:glutathione S-transferase
MLKLYGFTVSNYFNMVKMALIEKDIPFEFIDVMPSQDESFLKQSPMGKVPCISETSVIFDYIEELGTGQNLMPTDPFERAKTRELIKEIELYIELPARTCFAEAFFGGSVSDETKEKAKAALVKGMACLKRSGKFSPYVAGDTFTYADIMLMYSVSLASACAKRVLETDLMADAPEVKALVATLNQRESARTVAADQKG